MDEITSELLKRLDEKDARIKELTDLMLTYTGVIQPDVQIVSPEGTSVHPVGNRWNRIRPILESKTRGARFTHLAEEASQKLEKDAGNNV